MVSIPSKLFLIEKTNASLHDLMSDLSETKQNQLRLSAGVLSLEWFRNNITRGVISKL